MTQERRNMNMKKIFALVFVLALALGACKGGGGGAILSTELGNVRIVRAEVDDSIPANCKDDQCTMKDITGILQAVTIWLEDENGKPIEGDLQTACQTALLVNATGQEYECVKGKTVSGKSYISFLTDTASESFTLRWGDNPDVSINPK
jgi:hypothetical protein